MGFLRTNDLSEIKTGELNLDFGVWLKTGGVVGCKMERNKIKCKIELLEVLSYWGWISKATEGSQGLILALGRMTYSHFLNRIFIYL